MLGAVMGDIIGSVYEHNPIKTKDFPMFTSQATFTDDTVLTVAVADAILKQKPYKDFLLKYGRHYPNRGFGGNFIKWLFTPNPQPYGSFGNGSAMRISAAGYAFHSLQQTLNEAKACAEVSHNHPEGIKGAQATAAAVYFARNGHSKTDIRNYLQKTFGYDLQRNLEAIRKHYHFDVSCQGSVPEAIIAFLEATDMEDAIRNAVSLGGDADTQACIAGGIAEAFYGPPDKALSQQIKARLPQEFLQVMEDFYRQFIN